MSKKSQESKKTGEFRELRESLGWTVPRIAATLGLSTSVVAKRLAGDCNVRAGELAEEAALREAEEAKAELTPARGRAER